MASVSDVEMGSMKAKHGDVDVAVRPVEGAQIECKPFIDRYALVIEQRPSPSSF
jgi:hypothetical protein